MNRRKILISVLLLGCLIAPIAESSAQITPTPPGQQMFAARDTGFVFFHPKTWKEQITKKTQKLLIPVAGSATPATMNVFALDFRALIDRWEQAQRDIAKEMRRTVARQWQEEILGVPLLLSKVNYQKDGQNMVELTGLLYTATPKKLLFRIDSPADGYDDVENQWRTAFQSLRTTDSKAPVPDDPGRTLSKDELAPKPAVPLPVTELGAKKKIKLYEGKGTVVGKAANRDVTVHFPLEWTVKPGTDGSWLLTNSKTAQTVTLTIASSLDSDNAQRAIDRLANAELSLYKTVDDRDEKPFKANETGSQMGYVWRHGDADKGPLTTLEASIMNGDFYAVISFHSNTELTDAQTSALENLLSKTSVVGAP